MNYWDFKNKYNGQFIDYDQVYGPQCVDLIKQWIADNGWPMKKGNAIDWKNNADDFYHWVDNSPSAVPVTGDIIVFSVGQYGHIGVVESANVNTVDVLNQNWPHGNCTDPVQVTRFNYTKPKVIGWLHPVALDTSPVSVVDPKDTRIVELETQLNQCNNRPPEIKEIIKEVPVEKIVEKEVKVPVDRIVETKVTYVWESIIWNAIKGIFKKG